MIIKEIDSNDDENDIYDPKKCIRDQFSSFEY
jgi:hypothetical protein